LRNPKNKEQWVQKFYGNERLDSSHWNSEDHLCETLEEATRMTINQALVTHAYNPSYSQSKDEEDCGLKPDQANSPQDPISKITQPKKGWWSDSSGRAPA
jgi:hypothetical protein